MAVKGRELGVAPARGESPLAPVPYDHAPMAYEPIPRGHTVSLRWIAKRTSSRSKRIRRPIRLYGIIRRLRMSRSQLIDGRDSTGKRAIRSPSPSTSIPLRGSSRASAAPLEGLASAPRPIGRISSFDRFFRVWLVFSTVVNSAGLDPVVKQVHCYLRPCCRLGGWSIVRLATSGIDEKRAYRRHRKSLACSSV